MAEMAPVPLNEVFSREDALEWSHSVAIALQLVEQLAPFGIEPAGVFPDVDRIALSPTGFLLTQLERRNDEPLAGLGRLLHRLLGQTSPPAALRLVAMRASAARPTISFEELTRELAKWDSPDRLAVLSELYKRATGQVLLNPPKPPGSSLALLKERTLDISRWSRARLALVPQLVIAAAGAVTVSVVATYVWHGPWAARDPVGFGPAIPVLEVDAAAAGAGPLVLPQEPSGGRPAPRSVSLESTGIADARVGSTDRGVGNDREVRGTPGNAPRPEFQSTADVAPLTALATLPPVPGVAVPASPEPHVNATSALPSAPEVVVYSPAVMREAEEQFRRARELFERQDYAAAAAAFRQVVVVLEKGDPTLELRQIAAELAGASRVLSSTSTTRSRNEEIPVYTEADVSVAEPVALAHMPAPAGVGTPADQVGILELLIDVQGRVESAHLIGNGHRFRDRWWISAAKAWLFEPATKEGRPVRFLKRHTFLLNQSPGS